MDMQVLFVCSLIFFARVIDVTLGTLRTVWIVEGRRWSVFLLGFIEILVWIFAVSEVMQKMDNPMYAMFYALGFATGNYVGITLERYLAYGEQIVRIFSRHGNILAQAFRNLDFGVTVFRGDGRDSQIDMCFIETRRRRVREIVKLARELDPKCFYVIDTVQVASTAKPAEAPSPTGWRAILKKK